MTIGPSSSCAHARNCIADCGEPIDDEVFDRFADRLSYVSGDFGDEATYRAVAGALHGVRSPVFYLEIPPSLFGMVIEGLAQAGVTQSARVVVEKPFGHDAASASALNEEVHQHLDETQLYRIDHFLGYKGLDEIRYLRFANTMFEPIWNRNYISSVQLTMAESFGVEDRGHFYDPVGALRDVVVNHLLQVVATTAMEPPASGDPSTLKNAMVSVFQAMPEGDPAHYVRGQYDGYRSIDGVASDSATETYAALRLHENWRWSGVPFFIRTGKDLPITQTELRLVFKHPPRLGFLPEGTRRPEPDQLVVRLYPTTGIRLLVDAQRADVEQPEQVSLDLEFAQQEARARCRTRCFCTRRWSATAGASSGRTASRKPGGSSSRCSTPPRGSTHTRRGRGVRRRRTASWPGKVAGTSRGCRHERHNLSRATERGGSFALPADRRLCVPVRLPHQRARGPGRLDRLAVRAALRLAQRVRLAARSPGRLVPAGAVRDQRADGTVLRAGDERLRHHLEDANRLGPGARCPDYGPAAR